MRSPRFRARGRDPGHPRRGGGGHGLSAARLPSAAERLPVRPDVLGVRAARAAGTRRRTRDVVGGAPPASLPSVSSRRIRPAAGRRPSGSMMETRAIVAAILMAGVFIVYQVFFLPTGPDPASQQKPAPPSVASAPPPPAPQAPSAPTSAPPAVPAP